MYPPAQPSPIRRAVLKNAASAPEKKTPGHALMRGGGVTADRKIKLSSGARGPQWGLELVDWAARDPCCWASPDAQPPCCILEEGSLSHDLPYMGQLMNSVMTGVTSPYCSYLGAYDQIIHHCPPGSIRGEVPFQHFAEPGCKSKGHKVNCIMSLIYLVNCFSEKHGFRREGFFVLR